MSDTQKRDISASQRPQRWRAVIRGLDWLSVLFISYMFIGGLIRSRLPDRAYSEYDWHGCQLTSGWFSITAHCPETGLGRIVEVWVESTFVMELYPHALLSGNMLSGNLPWFQIVLPAAFALFQIFLLLWVIIVLVRLLVRALQWCLQILRA